MRRIDPKAMNQRDITMLKRAIKRDRRITIEQVLAQIYEGISALCRFNQSVFTLHKTADSIHVAQLAGVMGDIPFIHNDLVALAKHMEKDYIELNGRPGWKRVLKPLGYVEHNDLLRYAL
jgi:hypothetical protein